MATFSPSQMIPARSYPPPPPVCNVLHTLDMHTLLVLQDVLNTVAKEDIVVAGPFNLVQGGFGLIVRFPVWTTSDRNWDTWWGLVAALIFVDKLLNNTVHLDEMVLDYYYDLSFYNPNTQTIDLIRKKVPGVLRPWRGVVGRTCWWQEDDF